jgi:ADP-ribose pyrophosphatase YjhB (NUDIX family)
MSKLDCENGCCTMIVSKYDCPKNLFIKKNSYKSRRKAGVFVYNIDKTKILLVQSRGKFWGPPKGTVEDDEDWEKCALRELKEESGISVYENDNFQKIGFIKSNAFYFSLEKNNPAIVLQDTINNDANGIGWFSIDCLKKMIKNNKIIVNQHCKLGLKRIFNIDIE